MRLDIQPVTVADLSLLLELIRELARFEKLEHEVGVEYAGNSVNAARGSK